MLNETLDGVTDNLESLRPSSVRSSKLLEAFVYNITTNYNSWETELGI